jgi:hypothetical protein
VNFFTSFFNFCIHHKTGVKTSFVRPLSREGCLKLDHSIMPYFSMIVLISLIEYLAEKDSLESGFLCLDGRFGEDLSL